MKEETEDVSKDKEPLSEREKKRARQDDAAKRAAGHLPPEMDESTGKMINPHNPEFITKVPWYLGESGPTLKHHADQKSNYELSMEEADNLYARKHATQVLMKSTHQKVGYRKGACKNCGAMTHKEKDCVERPRSKKKAAVNSGLDIAHDEVMLDLQQHGKVGYSAKRDGWQGYDASEYQDRIDKYERIEAERRRLKKEEKEQRKLADATAAAAAAAATEKNGAVESNNSESKGRDKGSRSKQRNEEEDSGSDIVDSDDESANQEDERDEEDEDEDKTGVSKRDLLAADDQQRDFQGRMARQGGVGGNQMMVTARNLRIREDKPKYLRNLDLDSAHYDPKSRSMRANPTPGVNPADLDFAGDNFARQTGDAVELAKAQVLCWEMEEGGGTNINPGDGSSINPTTGVDIVSNPSQAALITKQYQEQKAANALEKRAKLAAQYGDASTITAVSATASTGTADVADKRRLLTGQSEAYMEYEIDASGRVVVKSNSNNNTQASSSKGVRFAAGATTGAVVTKYEEDVLEGNHTAVWGSYFDRNNRQWGYACCWSVLRGSYCTGEAGKKALVASSTGLARLMEEQRRKQSSSSSSSSAAVALGDDEKMKAALERAKRWQQQQQEEGKEGGSSGTTTAIGDGNDGKRSKKRKEEATSSSIGGAIDEPEDMEDFRAKRSRADDPMAHYHDIGE
jgi:pre-mRNA-processing factor SLU7